MAAKKTAKKTEIEIVISDRTYQSQQSWYRERIVEEKGARLRYLVRCNAYDFQSRAEVEVWRDGKWSDVHRIPGEQLLSKVSYVDRNVQPSAFDADIAELRRVALAIIGGAS